MRRLPRWLALWFALLSFVPAIAVGVAAYAYGGSVDVVAGGLLAVGAVVGAQLGTRVLMRLRRRTAQWIFVGFVSVMIVQLMLVVPDRGAELLLDPGLSAALVLVGSEKAGKSQGLTPRARIVATATRATTLPPISAISHSGR